MSESDTTGKGPRLRRRIIRRSDQVVRPFDPYGLLPALGLFLVFFIGLFPFAYTVIEASTRSAATEAADLAQADWAEIDVSGQRITIRGTAPDATAIASLEQAIENTTRPVGSVWRARPVTRVRNAATISEVPVGPVERGTPTAHNWTFSLARGVLDLSGDVPDEAMQLSLIDAARLRVAPPRFSILEDNLQPTGQLAMNGFSEIALRGINTVTRCDIGVARFEDETFSLSCEADESEIATIRRLATAPHELGRIGAIDIFSRAAAESCDQTLLALLSNAQIRFASSSAQIDAGSSDLLDDIAEAAKACPGRLGIDGHSDDSGQRMFNQRLSQDRAASVRDALIARGVAADRLVAEGFGPDQPVATNDTVEGRARNRRIEISVLRDPTRPSPD